MRRAFLEQEVDFYIGEFVRVSGIAVFGLSAKGLGCREDDVLGQGVVDADAPGFDVIQDAVIAPGVGRTTEERALVGVDVFDPGIPGAAGIAVSRFFHS